MDKMDRQRINNRIDRQRVKKRIDRQRNKKKRIDRLITWTKWTDKELTTE